MYQNLSKDKYNAHQALHDLSSPLEVIRIVGGDWSFVPEGKREIIRGALRRIREIAKRPNDRKNLSFSRPPSLSGLVREIVFEKRVQYPETSINLFEKKTAFFPLREEGLELQRVLSNLMDNAYQATPPALGIINVFLEEREQYIHLFVEDNGCGFEPKTLQRFQQGIFHRPGKKGQGLGLPHLQETAFMLGGEFEIESCFGKGGRIGLKIPSCYEAVHLEDDSYLRMLWKEKAQEKKIPLLSLETSKKLFQQLERIASSTPIYIDYRLNAEEDGLEVAKKLHRYGFCNIHLTSAYPLHGIPYSPYIKSLRGKNIPF